MPFSEVSAHRATLEEAYMELTRDAVEFRRRARRAPGRLHDDHATLTPYRSGQRPGADGFAQLLRAEWTKFRTVRGWVIGMIVAALVTLHRAVRRQCQQQLVRSVRRRPGQTGLAGRANVPVGPGGEAVTDSFYFVHQPLAGNGSITVRVTSLTGLHPGERQRQARAARPTRARPHALGQGRDHHQGEHQAGSAYAAMMVTGGHGVRMQYNYTHDTAGLPGAVSAASPALAAADPLRRHDHRLRLRRRHPLDPGRHRSAWPGCRPPCRPGCSPPPPTAQRVAAVLRRNQQLQPQPTVGHRRLRPRQPPGRVAGRRLDRRARSERGTARSGQPASAITRPAAGSAVTGSGDIAPVVAGISGATDIRHDHRDVPAGTFAGLIAVIVDGAMFITAEYRRGLIRTTLTASPRRGRVLAAKAIVIGSVAFVAGLAAAVVAVPIVGHRLQPARGRSTCSRSACSTELRVSPAPRRCSPWPPCSPWPSAPCCAAAPAPSPPSSWLIVLPYDPGDRLRPAARRRASGCCGSPRPPPSPSSRPRRSTRRSPRLYTPATATSRWRRGPGFAVLCGYAAVALGLAVFLLRRRDA